MSIKKSDATDVSDERPPRFVMSAPEIVKLPVTSVRENVSTSAWEDNTIFCPETKAGAVNNRLRMMYEKKDLSEKIV